ncbi:MAG: zf-HC2 domain-containing protein [Eubacterium sp.]|nr:zf-HC2 domain-containing protein [Eubacterium sp.]
MKKEAQIGHKEAAEMIPRYLEDDLKEKELRRFLEHVQSCHLCYEELETAFMVDRTVRYLDDEMDDDGPGSYNLTEMMQNDIREKRAELVRKKITRRAFLVLVTLAAVVVALMLLDFFGILQITRML